jgi:hypothetical protein
LLSLSGGSGEGGGLNMEKVIASFEKNSEEQVQVKLQDFKGRRYVDIRIWAREDAAWIPTYKGLTLDAELLGELRKAIDAAFSEVEVESTT